MRTSVSESRSVTATVRDIVGANPHRRTLTFFPSTVAYRVAPLGIEPSATVGYSVATTGVPFTLTRELHGDVVERPWRAHSSSTSLVLVVQMTEQDDPIV